MIRKTPRAAHVWPLTILATALGGALPAGADDHGDAPERYGVAAHGVTTPASIWLGVRQPDQEPPMFSLGADADDNAGDDEDGVFAFPALVQNGKAFSTNVFATNLSGNAVTLSGWVDTDGNGLFDRDEYASVSVPANTRDGKFKLVWPDLSGVSTDFTGETYARFRISSDALGAQDASGRADDGEVEDYTVTVLPDADGDERPDAADPDDDNDGIPDEVEVIGRDTDGDGTPDYLDSDSDADGVPDFIEAGPIPGQPADSDGDGVPDYLDRDSDNDGRFDGGGGQGDRDRDGVPDALEGEGDADGDGISNRDDLDSDNDGIPDGLERGERTDALLDTDADGVPDLLDLDSDDDGIPDLYESNAGEVDVRPLDTDADGRLDRTHAFGTNGFADALETAAESGIPLYALPDIDGDGVRDFLDRDSDGDGVADLSEAGRPDRDDDGQVDERIDSDNDGLIDAVDVDSTGGADIDEDGIDDAFDASQSSQPDFDGDGIVDAADNDPDGDGISIGANARGPGELPDVNGNGIPDFQEAGVSGVDGGAGSDGGTDGAGTTGGATTGGATTGGAMTGGAMTGGATTGGATTGGGTAGGGTTGTGDGTAGDGSVVVDDDDAPRDDASRVETGLAGGVGCSIATTGSAAGMDPLFALGLAGALFGLVGGRRRPGRPVAVRVPMRGGDPAGEPVKSIGN